MNRREFIGALLGTGLCAGSFVNALARTQTKRPNIVFFLVDDMGWQDTSVPFYTSQTFLNRRYRTPNMERLAQEGVLLTQAYAHPVCSPTRISLLTGMNPARHRVTMWTLLKDTSTDSKLNTLQPPPDWNINGVQPVGTQPNYTSTHPITEEVFSNSMKKPYLTATTLPELLQKNGYYTIHCGKAHFGTKNTPGANPRNLGFDVNIAGSEIGAPASYRGNEKYGKGAFHVTGLDENEYYENDVFLTEALTQEALKALDVARNQDKPFYLYMAHYAVHAPFSGNNVDKRFWDHYKDRPADGNGDSDNEKRFATLVEGMDKSLGDLLDYLDEHRLRENTIVLFMSDNGGLSLRGSGRIGNANFPLSYGKGSAREGGIREPMIVRWPGVVKPGTRCSEPLICEDFFPSILELAGVRSYRTEQKIDGQSFVPILRGKKAKKNRAFYWHCPNNWVEGSSQSVYHPYSAIRKGPWKLIYYYEGENFELFNIEEDISEERNMATRYPERVEAMAKELTQYLKSVQAQRPTRKKAGQDTGIPVPWPAEAL